MQWAKSQAATDQQPARNSAGDKPASAAVSAAADFAFDAPFREVAFEVQRGDAKPLTLWHRLAKPTREQMAVHQSGQVTDIITEGKMQRIAPNTSGADERLWAACVRAVKGYDSGDGLIDWRELAADDPVKAMIPPPHRRAAIDALYQGECEVLDEAEPLVLETPAAFPLQVAPLYLRLRIGPRLSPAAFVDFACTQASEEASRKFTRDRARAMMIGGSRQGRMQSQLSYAAFTEYLKQIVVSVSGATVGGKAFADVAHEPRARSLWLDAIDPLWAIEIVNCYQRAFEVSLQD